MSESGMSGQKDFLNSDAELQPEIRRARIGKLTIYEISEAELNALEAGSPSSLLLNFAIFLLSIAISFMTTLVTLDVPAGKTFVFFLTTTIVGFVGSAVLFLLWLMTYRTVSSVASLIRKRLPPDGDVRMPLGGKAEGETRQPGFVLKSAYYGTDEFQRNVMQHLLPLVRENRLTVTASTDIFGDPDPGIPKKLTIQYEFKGRACAAEIPEGKTVTLPENA
jgi:hypothetical protein